MQNPNIIIIYADQLRRSALGCYGDPNVSTPNIDKLASEGVRFENSYSVYPSCVPARFALLTGEYPHTRQIPHIDWRMSPCERTIAHDMVDVGYETCYIGKWHLHGGFARGDEERRKKITKTVIPKKYRGGFQKWYAFDLRNNYYDTYYHENDNPNAIKIEGYQTDGLFDIAIDYIKSERDSAKPFFTMLSPEAPHPPFEAPEEYEKMFDGVDLTMPPNMNLEELNAKKSAEDFIKNYKSYYAMIENLDYNIGRLVDSLEENRLKSDTVMIFTSDHGELMGSHGLMGKAMPHEESSGVPLIISHPGGKFTSGQVVDTPTSTMDIYPTLQDIAGINITPHNGLNLTILLDNQQNTTHNVRDGIMLEYVSRVTCKGIYSPDNWRAIISGSYKYVARGPSNDAKAWQLFDIQNDPYEMNNLINNASYKSIAEDFDAQLRNMIIETEDDYTINALSKK